jgi:hypothetical protein
VLLASTRKKQQTCTKANAIEATPYPRLILYVRVGWRSSPYLNADEYQRVEGGARQPGCKSGEEKKERTQKERRRDGSVFDKQNRVLET